MATKNNNTITVKTSIKAPVEKVWELYTQPEHITQWNFASDEWCCPSATNNLQQGGSFNWRMESRDGKIGFDFTGTYDKIENKELISYKMTDGRAVDIRFTQNGNQVEVKETFETEGSHSDEQQRAGWQAILDNFKNYVELK